MATNKNITMKQFNGVDYDTLYPKTIASQIDDVYSKSETLSNSTQSIMGLGNDATPDDAFLALFIGAGTYGYRVKIQLADGTPVEGSTVSGINAFTGSTLVSGADGIVLGKSTSQTVTISCTSPYIDQAAPASQSVTATGTITDVTLTLTSITDMITVTSSKSIKVSSMAKTMDATAGVAGGGAAFVKANKQSEYATVSVGDPTQNSHAVNMGFLAGEALADQPTQPHQIANKEYVDSCTGKCVQAVDSPNGVLKAYLQNGSRQDVCVVSDSGLSSSIARYTAKGHLIDQGAPTENNHLANKQYVDSVVKAGNFSGNVQVGGDLTINGTASVLKPPTQDVDIPNKGYVDASLSDVVRKAKVTVSGNSSVNVPLSNGVYLLAVSDNGHGGLVCVSVYPDGVTISGLVNLNGWTCTRTTGENSVTLKNTVASDMDIYITSVGEGAYR